MEKKNVDDDYKSKKSNTSINLKNNEDLDVQARYEQLVKSGATAISSDMLFGRDPEPK